MFLLFIIYYRNLYLVSTVCAIILSYLAVALDYYVRNFSVYAAAQPIFPAQAFLSSFALCCLFLGYLEIILLAASSDEELNSNDEQLCKHYAKVYDKRPYEPRSFGI